MTIPDKVKPFLFHGIQLDWNAKQAKGNCPFCGEESHFFVNTQTGQWDCKSCQASGNIPTFLRELLQFSQQEQQLYTQLAEDRKLDPKALKAWGVAKNPVNDCWVIPAYNTQGKLANLYKYENGQVLSSPGCKLHPFGSQLLTTKQETLWVCEGPWDAIALYHLLTNHRLNGSRLVRVSDPKLSLAATHGVLAVPGCQNFQPEWFTHFKGRNVNICFDNDHPRHTCKKCRKTHRLKKGAECPNCSGTEVFKTVKPGWDGIQRVVNLAEEHRSEHRKLQVLQWGKWGFTRKLADGFDLRDLITAKSPKEAYTFLQKNLGTIAPKTAKKQEQDNPPDVVEPLERTTFNQLCKDYESTLYFPRDMKDSLAVCLAIVTSTTLGGDQLWLRLIGPPGSGKSTLVECLAVSKAHTFSMDIFTGTSSGFKDPGKQGGKKDASIIPKMVGKTTIVKDGDTLLSSPNRDRILAEWRALYDGSLRAQYRNFEERNFEDVRTTIVICGTDDLRSLNRSSLGERFLDCEIFGDGSPEPFLVRSQENTYQQVTASLGLKSEETAPAEDTHRVSMQSLKAATLGYVNHLKTSLETTTAPEFPQEFAERIKSLGHLLALMRTRIKRTQGEQLSHRPRVELPTRLVNQLTKLAICVSLVLQKRKIDKDVYRIIRKVAWDTASGFHLEVSQALSSRKELSAQQVAEELGLPKSSVQRYLADMEELGIVTRVRKPNNSGIGGRHLHLFQVTETVKTLWKETGFNLEARRKTQC